jgi:hypothetical protein
MLAALLSRIWAYGPLPMHIIVRKTEAHMNSEEAP